MPLQKPLAALLFSCLLLAGCLQQLQPTPSPTETPSPFPEITAAPTPAPSYAASQTMTWAAVGVMRKAGVQVPLSPAFLQALPEVTQSAPESYFLESRGSFQLAASLASLPKLSLASPSFVASLKRIAFAQRFRKTLSLSAGGFDVTWASLDAGGNEIDGVSASLSKTGESKVCVAEKGRREECVEPSEQEVDELWKALQSNAFDESVKALLPGFSLAQFLVARKTSESSYASRACVVYSLSLTQEGLELLNEFGGGKLADFNATICLDKKYGFPLFTEIKSKFGSASEEVTEFSGEGTPTPSPAATASIAPTPSSSPTPTPAARQYASQRVLSNMFSALYIDYYRPLNMLLAATNRGIFAYNLDRGHIFNLPVYSSALGPYVHDLKVKGDLVYYVSDEGFAMRRILANGSLSPVLGSYAHQYSFRETTQLRERAMIAISGDIAFVYFPPSTFTTYSTPKAFKAFDVSSPAEIRFLADINLTTSSSHRVNSIAAKGNYLLALESDIPGGASFVAYAIGTPWMYRAYSLPNASFNNALYLNKIIVDGDAAYVAEPQRSVNSSAVLYELNVANPLLASVTRTISLPREVSSNYGIALHASKLYAGGRNSSSPVDGVFHLARASLPQLDGFQTTVVSSFGAGNFVIDEESALYNGGFAAFGNGEIAQLALLFSPSSMPTTSPSASPTPIRSG